MNSVLDSVDIFMELLCYLSAPDWASISLLSREGNRIAGNACPYILMRWSANPEFCIPQLLHDFLTARKHIELFVILSQDSHRYVSNLDESHRTLLDLSVDLHMYGFAEWLLGKGFKSNSDAETMFDCIRSHDIRGATVLLNCGIPVDRFRSRDDGLNVLTSSVMYGSPALVDMFILRGCSIPEGLLVQAILSRHSDYQVVDIVSILLDKAGCNPNSRSIMGIPVLHVAIGHSPFAHTLIELLVSRGADVNKTTDGTEGGGHTPLDVAAKKRKRACYDALVARGAVHSLLYGAELGDVSIMHSYLNSSSKAPPVSPDQIMFLICFSAALGRGESVKALIERIPINEIFVRNDITPLHLAACRGHLSICKLLIGEGANVSARAMGGMDIHVYASNITGSPLWFNPTEYGPNGSLIPPAVRLKTAAELAREAGYDKIARFLDIAMIETVIARKESFDSASSSGYTSPRESNSSMGQSPIHHRYFAIGSPEFELREE